MQLYAKISVLLAEVAKSFTPTVTKQYPLSFRFKAFIDEDKEQDVFSNLMHVQPHRRARALVQLRKRIDKPRQILLLLYFYHR